MNPRNMIIILLIIGCSCFVAAAWLYTKDARKNETHALKKETAPQDLDKEKGDAFEQFILDLFLQTGEVKLVSRNSDYAKDGHYAEDNMTPDLKFRYNAKPFAIECKYRTSFNKGAINWAREYQIRNYNQFEKESKQNVYIAIGIGGQAQHPERLFLVPLHRLKKEYAFEDYIRDFEIKDVKEFLKHL